MNQPDILSIALNHYRDRVETSLQRWLPDKNKQPIALHQAMEYALLVGGKRVRPLLVYATGKALGIAEKQLDAAACAMECIHAYSLVHDDLPAMDDDDLRRGKPTCHIAFDEATAILAGDALQTLAFEILSQDEAMGVSDKARLHMIKELAIASGHLGMVGGQAIDLSSVGQTLDLPGLEDMHGKKTGALIIASVTLGALHKTDVSDQEINSLQQYAKAIGLAFQVTDDILDIEGETEVIGKTQGADAALNKPTYPALMGLEEAKAAAQKLHNDALSALAEFDDKADLLRALSAYIVQRSY